MLKPSKEEKQKKKVTYQGSEIKMALKFSKQILKPEHNEAASSEF